MTLHFENGITKINADGQFIRSNTLEPDEILADGRTYDEMAFFEGTAATPEDAITLVGDAPRQILQRSDRKAEWESYAEKHFGYDPAEGLTKQELIDRYGVDDADQ